MPNLRSRFAIKIAKYGFRLFIIITFVVGVPKKWGETLPV
jgi:hypothetical protein